MSDIVLSARGIRKSYLSGDRRIEVLRGIDFDLEAGESVSIRGVSGCGKSTLLHLLAGLDGGDAGTVAWAGNSDLGARDRSLFLGIVFQAFYLIPEIDARENVIMARRVLGRPGPADRRRADELLDRVGLAGRARHLPAHLSGGERQRVAIARALMNGPRLILADEPTGNLDEETGDSVIELLLGLCGGMGTSLVLVTHDTGYAAKTRRQLYLHNGVLQ